MVRGANPGTVSDAAPARTHGGHVDDDRDCEFVDGEYTGVVATVALVCGSVATAEDSVQEALARAWQRLEHGDGIDRLPAWVTTVRAQPRPQPDAAVAFRTAGP